MSLFNFHREDNTKLHTKRQKEPAEIMKQTSGYDRPKQVRKWHNSMIARWWWWWRWWRRWL